jgi:hypothetical protein
MKILWLIPFLFSFAMANEHGHEEKEAPHKEAKKEEHKPAPTPEIVEPPPVINYVLVPVGAKDFLTQDPKNCYQEKKYPCDIKTSSKEKILLHHLGHEIYASEDSVLRLQAKGFDYLQGNLDARMDSAFFIKTAWGSIESENGHFLLFKEGKKLHVISLEGELQLKVLGDTQNYRLPSGFQTTFTPVLASAGKGSLEEVKPILVQVTMEQMEKAHPLSDKDKEEQEKDLLKLQKKAVEYISPIYQERAEREIAQAQELKQRREKAIDVRKKQESELRKLYRQKNYLD